MKEQKEERRQQAKYEDEDRKKDRKKEQNRKPQERIDEEKAMKYPPGLTYLLKTILVIFLKIHLRTHTSRYMFQTWKVMNKMKIRGFY